LLRVSLLDSPKRDAASPPKEASKSKVKNQLPEPLPTPVKQLVSPSESAEEQTPKNTRLESERDSSTKQESIKRGFPVPGSERETEKKPKPEKPDPLANAKLDSSKAAVLTPRPAPKSVKKSSDLRLSNSDILASLTTSPSGTLASAEKPTSLSLQELESRSLGKNQAAGGSENLRKNYVPFGRNNLSSIFDQAPGDSDFLPNIPDGEITLLNAKANKYAVFVRRVAIQVFGQLRKSSWSRLPFEEVLRLQDFAVVEATMSREGKLLKVEIKDSSGSLTFDRLVKDSAAHGTWDQNPPKGVIADDGNIHFIFEARTWARGARDGMVEQRWLLLGTGLL